MDTAKTMKDTPELHERLSVERVRIHFTQLPAIIIVPSLGGLFSAWVLWGAIENRLLAFGLCVILLVSVLRVLLYRWYFSSPAPRQFDRKWKIFALIGASVSGTLWGSAAIFLYPPLRPGYSL